MTAPIEPLVLFNALIERLTEALGITLVLESPVYGRQTLSLPAGSISFTNISRRTFPQATPRIGARVSEGREYTAQVSLFLGHEVELLEYLGRVLDFMENTPPLDIPGFPKTKVWINIVQAARREVDDVGDPTLDYVIDAVVLINHD